MKKRYLQPTLVLDQFVGNISMMIEPSVPVTTNGGNSQGMPGNVDDGAPWRW